MIDFGRTLALLRDQRSLSGRQLAKTAHVNHMTVVDTEADSSLRKQATLEKLLKVLEEPLDRFLRRAVVEWDGRNPSDLRFKIFELLVDLDTGELTEVMASIRQLRRYRQAGGIGTAADAVADEEAAARAARRVK